MSRKTTILIGDKSRHVSEFLRRELEEHGFNVQVAGDSKMLFVFLDVDHQPDLLILDLDFPYSGGIDVLLRLQNRSPSVPVIVHTDQVEYKDHPAVQGADAFVEKRGNPEDLIKTVIEVLKQNSPEKLNALNTTSGA